MKIIYNNIIPVPGFQAITLFGVIFARKKYKHLSTTVIRHEEIHQIQSWECGGWVRFYIKYLKFWFKYGYVNNPFEKDANKNEKPGNYLKRQDMAWKKFEKKK
jgi:hypothetical protein